MRGAPFRQHAVTRRRWSAVVTVVAACFIVGAVAPSWCGAEAIDEGWVASWSASATGAPASAPVYEDATLRLLVHLSLGASRLRVQLSNTFGEDPLVVGAAGVAVPALGSIVWPSSRRIVTFGGLPGVEIPAGAAVVSDPVDLDVAPLGDLAVSLFLPGPTRASTGHADAKQVSFVAPGDRSGSTILWPRSTVVSWPFLTRVDVAADKGSVAVVAVGDSITDGFGSSRGANRRWTDVLAARLLGREGGPPIAVVNAGINGNRVLHDGAGAAGVLFGEAALARFDRDVLDQPGAKTVIVLEGINDIGQPGVAAPGSQTVTGEDVVGGLLQMIDRGHRRGMRVVGGTLLPFEGADFPGYFTPAREDVRRFVNRWIRQEAPFDAVIDFDAVLEDPSMPGRLLPAYDSGDHVHPNDAGYRAMGEAVDPAVLVGGREPRRLRKNPSRRSGVFPQPASAGAGTSAPSRTP